MINFKWQPIDGVVKYSFEIYNNIDAFRPVAQAFPYDPSYSLIMKDPGFYYWVVCIPVQNLPPYENSKSGAFCPSSFAKRDFIVRKEEMHEATTTKKIKNKPIATKKPKYVGA